MFQKILFIIIIIKYYFVLPFSSEVDFDSFL